MRDYTKIEAWKLADDLAVAIYERTRLFPKEEIYGLTSQLRRAAYSVPANIVLRPVSVHTKCRAIDRPDPADFRLFARVDQSGRKRSQPGVVRSP